VRALRYTKERIRRMKGKQRKPPKMNIRKEIVYKVPKSEDDVKRPSGLE
jgi:hypothetical protein